MRKPVAVVVAIFTLVVLAGGGYLLLHGQNKTQGSMNMSSGTNSSASTTSTPVAANSVTIQNFTFTPASITVKKGTKVTWTNNDSVAHTVTETDGQTVPDSGTVNQGSSYSFTFPAAGTYHYHCAFHPGMLGTVVVTD